MPWVSDDQLRTFLDIPGNVVVSDFTNMANLLVSEDLVGKNLSTARMNEIAKQLAAHYYTVARQHGGLKKVSIGQTSETYKESDPKAQGLSSTVFGQQAIALDTSGTLASMATSNLRAVFRVV